MLFRDGIFSRLPTLSTERLVLRKVNQKDAADIYEYSQDEDVAKYVLWQAHKNISDTRHFIRYLVGQYRSDRPSSWAIVYRETGHVIGTIGFMWWNRDHSSAEVGYSLSKAYWNMGIMTEALEEVLRFGFMTLHLNRIEAQHEPANEASGRVMQKVGMTREGILRGRLRNKGNFVDVVLYAILRDDFIKTRKKQFFR